MPSLRRVYYIEKGEEYFRMKPSDTWDIKLIIGSSSLVDFVEDATLQIVGSFDLMYYLFTESALLVDGFDYSQP